MPSTYTGSGIELIGDGEQSGSWGVTTNTNLQIINRLVSEAGIISLSGTTHTLTLSDGTLSDGQYAVLVFGGAPSGTNTVTISPNDAKRVFIVSNTSGQTVVLTQGSGGNVTVLNNGKAIVYSNGAGASAAVVDITPLSTLVSLGVTATATELNVLDGITSSTAELNILDGVTASTAELNILDGVTATTAELNILDGVTATTAELNILDGVTATTAELNFTDGVTSNIQTQLNGTVKTTGDQTIAGVKTFSGGVVASSSVTSVADDDGELSSGTYTPTPVGGNFKRIEVDGPITLAAPTAAGDYTLVIQITITDSDDANIATSGFNRVSGDAFTYTRNHDFFVFITKCNGFVSATVQALQ